MPYFPRLKDGSKTAFEKWIKTTVIKQWDDLENNVYLSCFLDNHCNPLTAAACHKFIKFLLVHTLLERCAHNEQIASKAIMLDI